MFYVKKSAVLLSAVLAFIVPCALFLNMVNGKKKENHQEKFYFVKQVKLKYSHILIVNEESSFKNDLVKSILDYHYGEPILFSVINEDELATINQDLWEKIIILTSSQNNNLVQRVRYYINECEKPENVCLIVTTDSGKWYGDSRNGIDVIATASKTQNIDKISGEIIKKIYSSINSN